MVADASLDTNNDLEALAGVSLSYFRFKLWELHSNYFLYPSITSGGRVRQSLNAQLRLRLIRGRAFWLNFTQTLDLDNRPPENSPGTDFVTTTSLSWTFP